VGEYNEVYQRARYYDIAFSRDVSREVEFLAQLFLRHAGRPLRSMLDIACGPGYHARLFAKRGIVAYGLDLRPEMVDFARDQAEAEGVSAHWFAADMRRYTLADPVDLALNSYDSIDCLNSDDLVEHFATVARNLTPDGLYVFETTHPRDCFLWNYGNHRYAGERNGTKVEIVWAPNGKPKVDALNQTIDSEIVMRVEEHGQVREYPDRAREHFRLPQEYVALARLSGALTVDRFLGDFSFDQPFDESAGARRLIVVMRRAG